MNKIFKTKYDVTTGQTKVVSELANNRQVASRVEATESKPKCGVFLGMFKVLPLALVVSVALSSNTFAAWIGTYGGTVGSEKREMEYIYKGRDKYRLHGVALNPSGDSNDSNYSKVSIGGVAIGHGAWASGDNSTGVGADAHAIGGQSVVVGNNSGASNQSVAIGSDVFAYGKSSIAIGNDDVDNDKFNDRLPEKTIHKLFTEVGSNDQFFKDGWDSFTKRYIKDGGVDKRHYSPTYAKGIGSIAIGSRNIAAGEFATSLGALSFALADRSTAIGIRAFVDQSSTGGVAIGDESRVFASNSFAIGNKAESTNKGSLSYGSGAKAVGEGSIAIGSTVISNAKYKNRTDENFRIKIMSALGIGMVTEKVDTSNHVKVTSAEVSDLKVGDDNEIVQSGFSAHLDRDQINEKINKVIHGLTFNYEEEKDTLLSVGGTDIKKTKSDGKHGITIGYYTVNSGDNTVAIGTASYVKGRNSVVLGALNNVGQYASNTIAIGVGTNVHKENSIALGTGTTVTGAGVVAIGSGVGVTKDNTIAVGYGALGKSGESIVLGNSARLEDHASKSIVIGNGAKVENTTKDEKIKKVSWPENTKYRNGEKELEMSAIAIGTGAIANAQNSVAFGNEAQVSMENSVALGNKSHTKYFYQDDNNKNTATLSGKDAIELAPYIPEGSSYNLKTDKAAGIVSVGWTKGNSRNQELGLRRIVGVAPGALDSDVVTVGQLKALYYVKKEGVVTYYTKDRNNIIKLTKDADGKFYKVNTKDGTPYKDLGAVDAKNVFVGPKGANEKTESKMINGKEYSLGNMGERIKFANILDGEISNKSDQAITGAQLNNLGSILGIQPKKDDKTKFDTVKFEAVNVTDPKDTSGATNNFKEALTKAIGAINKGYKFNADQVKANANTTPFYLGATIEIKAGDVTKPGNTIEKYLGKNLKTEFKNDSSKATFTIGLKEDPSFKKVTIEDKINDGDNAKLAVNKEYVDNKLKNVSTNLHYLSVKGTDKGNGSNYNNDGAKGTHSVAIGVKASATANATSGIAIGYNAKSEAENAVAIGRDVSIDVPNSFVMGSNNTVTQNFKDTNGAVVVIGSGTKLVESKSSIAIGAVYKVHQGKADGTLIENAAWTASIGNKNKIKNGTDIVALGNNIQALDTTGEAANNGTKNANTELILIGNASKATSAKESVIIGAKAEAELKAKQAVIIGHSAKAETNAVGAVAIGQGATVKTDAGNSIALGQGSEATKKETAPSEASSSNSVKFKWTAGVGASKSVVSLGNKGKERQIKHVAAGAVTETSTDAINGSQLYAVADEFSKLAVNVLGAEVDTNSDKTGFKKSEFTVVQYHGSTNTPTPTQKEMTFKAAIDENIKAINKGFIFGVGDGSGEKGTHYLGDKLIIKAGAVDAPSTITAGEKYLPDNIKTAYLPSKKEIVIGIKESPSFKNVLITEEIPEDTLADPKKNTYDNYAVNKKYLDKRLEKVAANFTVKGDNSGTDKEKVYTLDKDHNELTIAGDSKNIETTVDKDHKKVSINLKDTLTGITSIANNDTKIELNNGTGGNGTKSIVFTAGDTNNKVTLTGNKFSGVSEIGKDENAKITFNSNGQKEIDFKAGSTTYKFTDSGLDLANKPITNLASGLDQNGSGGTNVRQGLDELLKLVDTQQSGGSSNNQEKLNKAINAGDLLHVANELKNKGLTFQGNGGNTDKVTRKLGETLKIVGETANGSTTSITTAPNNITVKKKSGANGNDTLEIGLSKNLKGIESVGKDENSKITFNSNGKNSIVFKAGNNGNGEVTLNEGGKFSGVSEISSKDSKSKLTLGADNATVELEHGKSKLELTNDSATLSAGTSAGSIKITSNGEKKIELSPENGATLTLAKDNGSSNVKATGLSHVGLNDQNALIFKNGSSNSNTAVLKVGNTDLTFTQTGSNGNQKVQISGLSSGLTDIGSSTGTSGNNSTQKLDELLKLKPQPSGTSNNQDKLSRAVNVEDLLDIAQGLVDKGITFQGDEEKDKITTKLGGTLKIVGETATSTSGTTATTQITTAPDNITVKKKTNNGSEDTLEIGLSDALKGITSISGKNDSNGSAVAKIEFNSTGTGGTTTTPNVKITTGTSTFSFGENGLDLGSKKLTALASGLEPQNSGTGGSTGNNSTVIENILKGTPDGTTGGSNSTSIANNAVNVKDLSEVAKAIVTKGLTFAGNIGEAKASLGDKITIKGDGTYLTSKASSNGSKEIVFSLTETVTKKLDIINVGTTNNGDNSFALGKNSKLETKKTAPSGIIPNAGKDEVKFSWTTAGASKPTNPADMKEVISVGNTNAERIITHVAAGEVRDGSTDAVNGGQLKSVIDVFANLGINVLGAEKAEADKDGFKKTTFTALKNTSGTNEATKDTFKDAINANTAKINEGLKFKGDNGGDKQLYLGSTLTIKGAETTAQTPAQGAGATKHQNITTTAKDGGILEIALNTNLKDITSIGKDENNVLTFKNGSSGGNSAELKVGGASLTFTKSDNGDKVKISGIADGESENDAVTVKQLTSSKLHYLSVKGNGKSETNYDNLGAKATHSIAIGAGASVKDDKSHDAIAIGYNSLVENAKWSMAIGANTQAKSIQSLALGYQAKVLEKSDASIAIGVSDTKIENAKWAVALGNKITITGSGNDSDNNILALGSNLNVGTGNADLIIIGNGEGGSNNTQITNAKNSVIIGKQAISKAESAVVLGKSATVQASATGAVAIGEGATVAETAGDSVAIGKNSRADEKMFAPDGIDANVGSQSLKINWKDAGASATDKDYKSVFSIGDVDNERVITNVAAGYVIDGSTDAVNGGQLYSVIHTFGNLASDVLGAEVNTDTDKEADGTPKYGFKKSTFTAVNYKDSTKQAKDTFKGAIDETITAINKGLKFAGNTGGDKQLQLGDTLAIKGKEDSANSSHKNISTEAKDGGILEIALNSELKGIQSIANGDNAKIALDKDAKTIKFTSGDTPTEVSLKASTLSGITEINKATDKGALKLTENSATLESTKDNSKLELKDKTATLESAKDKSKLELAEDSATLSAGNGKGSIKVSNGTSNKIELSPENGSTLELTKDTANGNKVKATGLSTVGLNDENALVFKNGTSGTSGTNTAELKVGGATLTFTPTNGTGNAKTVKISNVAVGKIESSSSEAITGGQLADLATHLGVYVDSSGKTAFTAPSFNAINGGITQKTFKGAIDQLITAVNGGLTFKGNDTSPTSTTLQLGGTLTIDSSAVGSSGSEKDITVTLTPSTTGDTTNAGTLTLKLNKADKVNENDEKVVTSKAVATALKDYAKTADLGNAYLKIDGSNIGKDDEAKKAGRKTFGKNVGIAEIKLGDTEKSSTELVQADAVIKYLKGKGQKSVKVSDNPETEADGEGAIAIGDKAVAKNEGAIAIGYDTSATNRRSVAIGREAQVLGEHATAIGYKNNVSGNDSGAFGKDNKISGTHAYAVGAYNDIKGEHTYVLGSSVKTDANVKNAVILGNRSTGISDAVSVGSKDEQRRIVYVADPTSKYDAVNKNYVDELKITYKANGNEATDKKQTVKLTDGLDFKKGKNDNIEVVVDKNGSIQHNLANNLKDVESISGGTDDKGAKITLGKTKKEINFNDAKLKEISEGEIEASSKEAVTGKQLADLAGKLGIDVDDKKMAFKSPSFNDLKITGVDGQKTEPAPKNIVEGLKNAVTKLNEGLKFGGDVPTGTNNGTHYLGSTIQIVRLATPSTTGTPAPTATPSSIDIGEYKGDNLITRYMREDNGNAKIEIGFKNAPMFEKVTLSKSQMYDGGIRTSGNTDWKNELITKDYLEQALDKFKFKVSTGDDSQPIEIGRGDTLKFNAGQNIDIKVNKNGAAQQSADMGSASASVSASAPTPTTASKPSGGANSADSMASSSAVPSGQPASPTMPAGTASNMASSGSSPSAAPTISQPTTGTQNGSDTSSMTSSTSSSTAPSSSTGTSSNTTAEITIATKEDLENIKSISSPKKGNAGAGSSAVGNQDEVTKLTLDPNNGATFQVGTTGSKVKIDKDGISLTPQGANGASSSPVETPSIVIKAGAKPVDKNSLESFEKDQGPSIAFSTKDTDGKKIGSGKITGLADIKEGEKDGTIAVNKNYVDKLDKVTVKYDDEHKKSITLGGKPKNGGKAHDPVAINNLKSGLGLDDMKDKPDSQKNGLSLELVKKLVSNGISSQKGQQMTGQQDLHQAANLADLKAVAQAGLRFKGNQGDDVVRRISDTLTIKGEEETQNGQTTSSFSSAAGNIKVETNTAKDGLEIKLSDTLKNMKAFETKEEGGKKSTLNSDGLTVVNKNGSNKDKSATYGADNIMLEDKKTGNKATITAESLTFADNTSAQNPTTSIPKVVLNKNGLTVTGKGGDIKIDGENGIITVPDIKPTTSESAVVNKKYVDTLQRQTDQKLGNLEHKLDMSNKELRAGVAQAVAQANLPVNILPGKSTLSLATGNYMGTQAFAVGYSRVSDNGKLSVKFSLGHGDKKTSVGAGIGYSW